MTSSGLNTKGSKKAIITNLQDTPILYSRATRYMPSLYSLGTRHMSRNKALSDPDHWLSNTVSRHSCDTELLMTII